METELTKYQLNYEHIKDAPHFQELRVLRKLRELRKKKKLNKEG